MLLILDPDCAPELLAAVSDEARAAGFELERSDGPEQIVLALSGAGDLGQLEAALARRPEVDLVPLLSGKEYGRVRARRRFMAATASGLGLVTAAAAGLPVLGYLMPTRRSVADRTLVPVAREGDLEVDQARRITLLGEPVFLVRLEGDRYFALSAICTHMNVCQLEWSGERRQLVCPCHGGAFDVYGNVAQGPASIPLPSLAVEQRGDTLYLRRRRG